MFNSTHTLAGIALARAGLNRWAPYATWTAIIASNLPDIDIVAQFSGTATYLNYHRGITHTVVALPVLSLLLAIVMARVSNYRLQSSVPLRNHFAVAFIAMATHTLLDWTNTYGVRPFLPLDATWYYGDALFIIDPYLDLVLLVGIIVSSKHVRRERVVAAIGTLAALIYIGVRIELRGIARQQLAKYTNQLGGVLSAAVQPQMMNPLSWTGLVETETGISTVDMDLLSHETRIKGRMTTSPTSPVVVAAGNTYSGRVFKNFARFPVTRIQEEVSGYRVLFIDVRFVRVGNTSWTGLAAEITLNRSLQVVDESISFTRPLR
jgi:inner membrane protein